jgi:hypothetical protein
MRNREATLRKLDSVESNLNRMILTLNQGDRNACYGVIEALREQVEQLKMYIESEPITGDELNRIS